MFRISALAICLTVSTTHGQYFEKTAIQYFPKSSVDRPGDHFKTDWYSAHLQALQEPSLFLLSNNPSKESYRFLWLRSFHHPVTVRLEPKPDGTSIITTKIGSGDGGFRPGVLEENTSRLLKREQAQAFLEKVDKLGFWAAPNPVEDQKGTDGSQWIIEGIKGGRYHVVDRWSPTGGPARELGMMLAFDLAEIKIPTREIY